MIGGFFLLLSVAILACAICTQAHSFQSDVTFGCIASIRAGKTKYRFGNMVKAFWISLISPGDTNDIINEESKSSGKSVGGLLGNYSLFGKKKPPKGRSLK